MDPNSENISYETINLPDDILILLAKKYVTEVDGLSLSVSGASENFASFFGRNRKRLVISNCFFLALSPWNRFFEKHITASVLTSFDASHCYWLPADSLATAITKMTNLEELKIQDTKISLGHLPSVFQACQKISKLSFTLAEQNMDQYQEGVMGKVPLDWMKQGFRRLTQLKIFTFALDENCYENSWLATLGVLIWCRDCVELHIQTSSDSQIGFSENIPQRVRDIARDRLLPHLGWMRKLESLTILRYDPFSECIPDFSPLELLSTHDHLLEELSINLERLWIMEGDGSDLSAEDFMTGPTIKSIVLEEVYSLIPFELEVELYRHLEHLAGIAFRRLDYLPELTYFRGYCQNDEEGLNDFCQSHPMLEQLHIDAIDLCYAKWDFFHAFGQGDWRLLALKVLVYYYRGVTFQTGMGHLINSCPNIEELHLNNVEWNLPRDREDFIQFLSPISFQYLTWLNIREPNLFDGSYLPSIIMECPKLERIHLETRFVESPFFTHLAECLPSATNLRDLRLNWKNKIEAHHVLLLLKALLKCSTHFERLVLINETNGGSQGAPNIVPVQSALLLSFVSKMTHLVALCLVGFQFDSPVDVLKKQIAEEVTPHRPAFWFHLGPKLPKGNDITVPRIHYYDIVSPIDALNTPPRF